METKNLNIPSLLLNDEENEYLFSLLGHKSKSRSSAVVEVYGTSPPHHTTWEYLHCGVAAFVKDFSRRSFFIQVYNIEVGMKIFEQEIYEDFYYNVNPLFFHQFEAENEIIGLNFASEEEADHFGSAIVKFVERKRHKKSLPEKNLVSQNENNENAFSSKIKKTKSSKTSRRSKKKLRHRRVSKSEIGEPENFRHIQHVGLDTKDEAPTDKMLACYIDMSHIHLQTSNTEYSEPELLKTIPIKDERPQKKICPPVHSKAPRPKDNLKAPFSPKPKYQKPELPLAPKPSLKINRSVSVPQEASAASLLLTVSGSTNSPPPPPPPPLPQPQFTPQMKPNFVTQKSEDSSLNKNIKSESGDCLSSRADLLSEIRNPTVRLKHVDSEKKMKPLSTSTQTGLMNSLAKTLDNRGLAFRGDSDNSDNDSLYSNDDDDDDSDW